MVRHPVCIHGCIIENVMVTTHVERASSFVRGPTSETLAKRLIEQANLTKIEDAISAITRYCDYSEA